MRVVITGGAGFLGQHLVAACVREGLEVSVLDWKPPSVPLVDLTSLCRSVQLNIDITTPESLSGCFDRTDAVIHLAGLVSFWGKHKHDLMKVNVAGTRNVVSECRAAGVRRLIHASSVAAIGFANEPHRAIDETFSFDWRGASRKYYMLSKHLAEQAVLANADDGFHVTIANPGLMWGPGDLLNSPGLLAAIQNRRIPAFPPGGTNIVDVRDVANGLVAMLRRGRSEQRYILGGVNIPFGDVCRTIARQFHVSAPSRPLPRLIKPLLYWTVRINELLRSRPPQLTADHVDSSFLFRYFSSAKAIAELGWIPRVTLEETIRDSIAWLRQRGRLA